MLTIREKPLREYVALLRARTPFAVSRWGDGEWMSLLGHGGATCDGQPFSEELRKALTAVLQERPTYDLALGPFAIRRFGPEIEAWLARRDLTFEWSSAVTWAYAARDGRLGTLIEALRSRTVILVGPLYLSALRLFPVACHIVVPGSDAFSEIDRIKTQTWIEILARKSLAPVVAVSAGPAAKVLVHAMALQETGATVIDFGSVWDPWAGRISRTYQKSIDLRRAL